MLYKHRKVLKCSLSGEIYFHSENGQPIRMESHTKCPALGGSPQRGTQRR